MTFNRPDAIWYEDELYVILREPAKAVFDPESFGMKPAGIISAGYRGWWADYAIIGKKLFLMDLFINCADDNYPMLNGVEAQAPRNEMLRAKRYSKDGAEEAVKDVVTNFGYHLYRAWQPLDYSGAIEAGANRVVSSLGGEYMPPWAFGTVLSFSFEDGFLISVDDISGESEAERRKRVKREAEGLDWMAF